MKRILIALAVLASVQVAGAQNIETAKKNLEAAKAACENVKKAAKVATWINLGNKFIDAYNAPIGNAWVGADVTSLTLAMGNDKPVSTENVVLNGTTYTKQVYKDKNIYINEAGVVDIIEVTNPVCADPLSSALEAFVKAAEVDVKATKLKDIANGIKSVSEKYVTDAYSAYSLGNIESARDLFVAAYNASALCCRRHQRALQCRLHFMEHRRQCRCEGLFREVHLFELFRGWRSLHQAC